MKERDKNSYQTYIHTFLNDDIYIVCPNCNKQAFVKVSGTRFKEGAKREIRLVCTHCGHSKTNEQYSAVTLFPSKAKPAFEKYILIGAALDPYFHLPLWLATDCCGKVLWAYNYAHLAFLKSLIAAKLRERNGLEMSNQSLGSRLPRWMTASKNRESVLRAIEDLQNKQHN